MNYFIESDGKDLKKEPLNVAVYLRVNGCDSMYCYYVCAKSLKEYIENETNWYLAASYIDFDRSGLYNWSTSEISDMMTDIEIMQENKDDPNWFIPYDMVVVFNFEQLFTLEMDKDFYLDLGFPTFCVDREKFICRDLNARENIVERARIRFEEENDVKK